MTYHLPKHTPSLQFPPKFNNFNLAWFLKNVTNVSDEEYYNKFYQLYLSYIGSSISSVNANVSNSESEFPSCLIILEIISISVGL